MHEYAKQNNLEVPTLPATKPANCLCDDAVWTAYTGRFNTAKALAALPSNNVLIAKAANKFAVDIWCGTISFFKGIDADIKIDEIITVLGLISTFTMGNKVGRVEYACIHRVRFFQLIML